VLFTALRAIDSLKILLAPFIPFSAQALHEMLGYSGSLTGTPRFESVSEPGGRAYRVLTGDYRQAEGRWAPSQLPAARPLAAPRPLFRKLDTAVVDEELARLERLSA
jgi:methionyl-tRNA synthetase